MNQFCEQQHSYAGINGNIPRDWLMNLLNNGRSKSKTTSFNIFVDSSKININSLKLDLEKTHPTIKFVLKKNPATDYISLQMDETAIRIVAIDDPLHNLFSLEFSCSTISYSNGEMLIPVQAIKDMHNRMFNVLLPTSDPIQNRLYCSRKLHTPAILRLMSLVYQYGYQIDPLLKDVIEYKSNTMQNTSSHCRHYLIDYVCFNAHSLFALYNILKENKLLGWFGLDFYAAHQQNAHSTFYVEMEQESLKYICHTQENIANLSKGERTYLLILLFSFYPILLESLSLNPATNNTENIQRLVQARLDHVILMSPRKNGHSTKQHFAFQNILGFGSQV